MKSCKPGKGSSAISVVRAVTVLTLSLAAASSGSAEPTASGQVDAKNGSSINLTAAQAGATAIFGASDVDKSNTLDARELTGRLDQKTFVAADHDLDGSLDPPEYAAVVEARFKAVKTDAVEILDQRDLASPAGARLLQLIR
jgi:hypothetical protein